MNQDDVIRMAREAGAAEPSSLYGRTDYVVMSQWELKRFAALVAAAEREACAKVAEEPYEFTSSEVHRIAAAIRAMGNT